MAVTTDHIKALSKNKKANSVPDTFFITGIFIEFNNSINYSFKH
ncbi:hypothetical protein [Mucilaginibacter paludis]|uniref:Uncharacterized protein n=1 Tax=Mucilaginibacter paludis DSM 18603 TaxID=714943 RepID=H1Y3P9_9SPHI|nr:hypothetical protein [Mucilaginibacter paludis]EHQ30311.1 hypothetical protein Mucpa_6255 [Mucilaginibacter paludis DSM 18603]